MLFTTPAFLFFFLPLFIICTRVRSSFGPISANAVLLLFSLLFYASWDIGSLFLLSLQILCNYWFATQIMIPRTTEGGSSKLLLGLAIFANCLPLLWCKYAHFFASNLAFLLSTEINLGPIVLPPGISFYTFIQIAWLVSVYRGSVQPAGLARHALFSSFFPYVLSGPIVRYEQLGAQFDRMRGPTPEFLALGFSLFCVGLTKKLLLADSLAPLADAVFGAALKDWPITCVEAWLGALSYSFQLYFDFSGYTDMAIGIGLMVGLQLPENFISPYKATGIVDFWRRWHITLGLWLRDFLYIPLGGNRHGKLRQYRNLFLTMLIGGIWHGAGWTFVIWGALHGLFLCINHAFRSLVHGTRTEAILSLLPFRIVFIAFTFFLLTLCWVFFRAESVFAAFRLLETMFTGPLLADGAMGTLTGIAPNHYLLHWYQLALLGVSAIVIWCFPCSHEIFTRKGEENAVWLRFRFSRLWALVLSIMTFASLLLLSEKPAFLYFQF